VLCHDKRSGRFCTDSSCPAGKNVPVSPTAEAVHEPGPHGGTVVGRGRSETSVSHHLWGVVLPDRSEQRALAAAIASGPDKRALALWRELTQASHLPEPRGEVVRVLRPDDVPWRWPLRPLERDAGLL
jgi:hypothetical protein